MELSERKRKILKALTAEHIKTNEPVSSKDIAERYLKDISSATVRNEMASLEEQGVIAKTHISSGRVPTTLGYQMFIEEILPMIKPTAKEIERIKVSISSRMKEMGSLVEETAKALSDISGLPSVALSGVSGKAIVQSIKIFKITENQCLVVVVTNEGIIKDIVIDNARSSEKICQDASSFLTKAFYNKPIEGINKNLVSEELNRFGMMLQMLIAVVEQQKNKIEIATSGSGKLFDKFENVNQARGLYQLMEDKTRLKELVNKNSDEVVVQVKDLDGTECAVVSATIHDKNNQTISVAVMGPARMDYEKVIKTIKGFSKIIDKE